MVMHTNGLMTSVVIDDNARACPSELEITDIIYYFYNLINKLTRIKLVINYTLDY